MPQNKNTVELIGHYGSDESHALSAWTSTSRDLTQEKKGRIDKWLKMLAENGHHSVFEKSSLHFLVTTDVASHIHLLKHRIGVSINAESARYKELKDDNYYLPNDWPVAEQVKLAAFLENAQLRYHQAIEDLVKSGVSRKRAKESARFYLPYANQITADVMFNWRSFHHFLQLRKKPDAQKEIFDIASQMLQLVKDIPESPYKHTISAFGYDDDKK
jgi:flavin-dependent thymidylate synthase